MPKSVERKDLVKKTRDLGVGHVCVIEPGLGFGKTKTEGRRMRGRKTLHGKKREPTSGRGRSYLLGTGSVTRITSRVAVQREEGEPGEEKRAESTRAKKKRDGHDRSHCPPAAGNDLSDSAREGERQVIRESKNGGGRDKGELPGGEGTTGVGQWRTTQEDVPRRARSGRGISSEQRGTFCKKFLRGSEKIARITEKGSGKGGEGLRESKKGGF